MICKHSIESEDGCKLCWKERAEKAEAAQRETQERIEMLTSHYHWIATQEGWLSPDKAKLLVKALERIIEIRPYERCNDVGHVARQALAAAAKGKQK